MRYRALGSSERLRGIGRWVVQLDSDAFQADAVEVRQGPLELAVEAGIPGLLAGVGVFVSAVRTGLARWAGSGPLVLPGLAAVAVFAGLGVQGLTDTIFFRPEVQLVALFCLATLAASGRAE